MSKFIKYASLGIVAFVTTAELYYHCTWWLRRKLQEDISDINEIIYTRSSLNLNSRLTKNIDFDSFEPSQYAVEVITNLILSAKDTCYVAVYIFSSDQLAKALIASKKKGVEVKCILDASMEVASHSKLKLLHSAGIPLKIHDAKMMHLKLCIIDVPSGKKQKKSADSFETPISIPSNGIVITGSLNWTREALMSNEENFIVTSNSNLCQSSAKKFEEIWKSSRLY